MANYHDSYRQGASQNVAYAAAGGASAPSAVFGPATYWIRVCAVGLPSATLDGVRIVVGDGTPVADANSTLLPLNWVEIIAVTPGQKIAVLGNNSGTGSVNVTELS